jgi:hypothetical protein
MAQNSVEHWKDLAAAVADERESNRESNKEISDLIEQLERDLTETQRSGSKRR